MLEAVSLFIAREPPGRRGQKLIAKYNRRAGSAGRTDLVNSIDCGWCAWMPAPLARGQVPAFAGTSSARA